MAKTPNKIEGGASCNADGTIKVSVTVDDLAASNTLTRPGLEDMARTFGEAASQQVNRKELTEAGYSAKAVDRIMDATGAALKTGLGLDCKP